MAAAPKSVSFETTLHQTGNNTGIIVPPELIAELGAGKRPPVVVDLDGYVYRSTVGVMGGKHMVSVSAAVRKETGLRGNDDVRVRLTLADEPRPVEVPDDLEAAFVENEPARAFFESLSNSLQRFHIDNINGAKTPETRQRRIDKSVSLFLEGEEALTGWSRADRTGFRLRPRGVPRSGGVVRRVEEYAGLAGRAEVRTFPIFAIIVTP